jgi:hypothetical protein
MKDLTRFPEIKELVDDASDLEIDILENGIRMYVSMQHIRPAAIRNALLEDGKVYPEEKDTKLSIKTGCIAYLCKLVKLGILSCEPENGLITQYSIFNVNDREKFNYLSYLIVNSKIETDLNRYGNLVVEAKMFDPAEEDTNEKRRRNARRK